MITSKQRAYLRSIGQNLDPTFNIGLAGVTPELVIAVDKALEVREILKVNVLKNCEEDVREACDTMCGRLHAEPVQCIGRKFVIYRASKKDPKIILP